MSTEQGRIITGDDIENEPKKKKVRGATRLDYATVAKAREMGIKFNERGQPYGPSSVTLSTFMGTLVRQVVPVTFSDWDVVPKSMIDGLWETIKVTNIMLATILNPLHAIQATIFNIRYNI